MSNLGRNIPPLNLQVQEDCLLTIPTEDELTGEQVSFDTTHLRWLLNILEKILFVETLPEAFEIASDSETACPICYENYGKQGKDMAILESGRAIQREGRPLKLECGHVICIGCLRRIVNKEYYREKPRCPLCRHLIDTVISEIPLSRRDGPSDYIGHLCCVIRLYILINPNNPETMEGLTEWVHSPTFQGKRNFFARMRVTVEQWGSVGSKRMWLYILGRRDGLLPNREFRSEYGDKVLIRTRLNSSTPVLHHTEIFEI